MRLHSDQTRGWASSKPHCKLCPASSSTEPEGGWEGAVVHACGLVPPVCFPPVSTNLWMWSCGLPVIYMHDELNTLYTYRYEIITCKGIYILFDIDFFLYTQDSKSWFCLNFSLTFFLSVSPAVKMNGKTGVFAVTPGLVWERPYVYQFSHTVNAVQFVWIENVIQCNFRERLSQGL